jgi:peptidoglycan/xylan/chitin deacetylase (PgdA/CDA1 family)
MFFSVHNMAMAVDDQLAKLPVQNEKPGLIGFYFHSVFRNNKEIAEDVCDPQQAMTLGDYRVLIETFLNGGYEFVASDNILTGLSPHKKYVYLTFDDGYFNNWYMVDVLNEFQVPATFFITSQHVLMQKSFWWDALYRNLRKSGATLATIHKEGQKLKQMHVTEIERVLHDEFGSRALTPIGDIDRPFTETELVSFAGKRFVNLGNHTSGHAILGRCDRAEVVRQVMECQDDLKRIVGFSPSAIAYPDGGYSREVLEIIRDLGFQVGVTTVRGKNYFPLKASLLELKRFTLRSGYDVTAQSRIVRLDYSINNFLSALKRPVR